MGLLRLSRVLAKSIIDNYYDLQPRNTHKHKHQQLSAESVCVWYDIILSEI